MKFPVVYKYGRRSILFLLLWQLAALAQDSHASRLFLDVPYDTVIVKPDSAIDSLQLPHHFLIPRSERIYRNGFKLLPGIHYRLNERRGVIYFIRSVKPPDSLTVIYRKYPFPLKPEYFHREIQKLSAEDSTVRGAGSAAGVVRSRFMQEIDSLGENLQRSGSIVRGVEIGSNRDLTLNSGLNLQLSGYITPDVQLVAALTDESTPIQPEGNTQTLREVDKVFVKIKSPHLGGTLGDFNLQYQNSLFGNLKRKLQGISAYGEFGGYHQQVTYATSRGTFHTNRFLGQEGNQGPYQLVGKNGEREIIVLAGTEKVYVNGQPQQRGENNDYTIDYSLGQITFTNNRLITSEDRIEVDFEYANNFQRYGKSLIGFSASRQNRGNGLSYDIRLFREWDDTRNLLEDSAPLTEQEKIALANAGDDRLKASVSGATQVGAGKGNYVKQDTVIDGTTRKYYRYVGSGNGDYTVRFTGVGRGNGDYVKERLGVYRYVGPGLGDYLPIYLVPLAGDKKFADVGVSYRFGEHFSLQSEVALSLSDQNIFSDLDDEDNLGEAYMVGAGYENESARLWGKTIGALNWRVNWKRRQQRFSPLDRQYRPEYNYTWNLTGTDLQGDENILEYSLRYRPWRAMQMLFDGGWIRRGALINSRRGKGQIVLSDSTVLKGEVSGELVSSTDVAGQSDWQRWSGTAGRQVGKFFPYLTYRQEDRRVQRENPGLSGFYFSERGGGLKLHSLFGMNWYWDSRIRVDYLYNPHQWGERLKLATSRTHQLNMRILKSKRWQGGVFFVYRDKDYQPFFEQLPADSIAAYQPDPQFQDTTWSDRQSHLAKVELQYRNADRTVDSRWDYRVASELQALQEKVFLKVEENRGNYRFDEDLQEYVPDPQGDYLLIIVPTGQFESVTNVEASWQFRYRPRASREPAKGLDKLLRNISTFTYLKVDEKSRERNIWQLYILNLKKYHRPATTLRGSYTINQDIYLFERNPDFGITLRSRYRDNLYNQYIDAGFNETRVLWERSVNWRQRLWGKKLNHELEYKQTLNTRRVEAIPSRDRDVFSHALTVKLNYRPVYAWQLRLGVENGWQKDRAEANPLAVRYLEVRPQLNFSMRGKARAIASLSYLRVDITENPRNKPIPFEMGKGKKEGNSFLWNARFEYFVNTNVTISVNYNGRRDAGADRTIHLGQAEVRAFF